MSVRKKYSPKTLLSASAHGIYFSPVFMRQPYVNEKESGSTSIFYSFQLTCPVVQLIYHSHFATLNLSLFIIILDVANKKKRGAGGKEGGGGQSSCVWREKEICSVEACKHISWISVACSLTNKIPPITHSDKNMHIPPQT